MWVFSSLYKNYQTVLENNMGGGQSFYRNSASFRQNKHPMDSDLPPCTLDRQSQGSQP